MDYLVDTNVLLRFADRSDPRHGLVRDAVRKLLKAGHRLRAAEQNFVELWTVATRPKAQNGAGMKPEAADRQLRLVERLFSRLPHSDLYPEWRRIVTAFEISGVKAHDARLVAAMNANQITRVLTFNVVDFKRFMADGIVAVDPVNIEESSDPADSPTPHGPGANG